jgi:hypothetical protein
LAVLLFFLLVKAFFFAFLGHHWILAHVAFSLFTDVFPGDVIGARSGLDCYSSLNHCFHRAYK